MNERQLVSDVLAVLKSHVDDPFLTGQIARAEDDIDLERPVPDFRHEAQRFADYVSTSAYGRADSPDKLTRRHIYDAVLGALRDRDEWGATPPAYEPPEEFTGIAFDRCPDAHAQGRRDRCGQFSHLRLCDDTLCAIAGELIPAEPPNDRIGEPTVVIDDGGFAREVVGTVYGMPVVISDDVPEGLIAYAGVSGAHAPEPVDDTTTELDTVWSYRMVNRGQYAITRDGADVAEILFHDRIPGTAAVVPAAAEALAKANHGRFVDPRNTPRSQR